MYIQLCDRCGRITNNAPAFILAEKIAIDKQNLSNENFKQKITLCNNCLEDFEEWRVEHETFNKRMEREKS